MIDIYCVIIIILAFGGSSIFGFGGGLISVPLLSLVLDVQDAVVLTSIFQFFIGFLIFKNFRSVPWKLMPPLVVGILIGIPLGVYSLTFLEAATLRWLLAIFILIFLIRSIYFPSISVIRPSIKMGVLSGIMSGFFQGCLGTGGPNLIFYLKEISPSKESFRAGLMFLLAIANLVRLIQSVAVDIFTQEIIFRALISMPFYILAIFIGEKTHHHLSEKIYFKLVYSLLGLSAVSLIIKNFAG